VLARWLSSVAAFVDISERIAVLVPVRLVLISVSLESCVLSLALVLARAELKVEVETLVAI